MQINNNLIAPNGGSGVDINAIAVGVRAALLQNNSIQNNGEDGIEFQNFLHSTDDGFLIGFGNSITGNQSR